MEKLTPEIKKEVEEMIRLQVASEARTQALAIVREFFKEFIKSDRYVFEKNIQFLDGVDFQFGRTTGTRIGTSASQKIGFYNKLPVAQQTGVAVTAGGIHAALVALGLITA